MRAFVPVLALIGAGLLLSGCGQARQAFGIDRSTPDEFAVVSRAPLEVPPVYELRPPLPGAPRPQEGTAANRGAAIVLGQARGQPALQRADGTITVLSRGEALLLQQAAVEQVPVDIRRLIDEESDDVMVADRLIVERILFPRGRQEPAVTLDATEEAQRLAAEGQRVVGPAVITREGSEVLEEGETVEEAERSFMSRLGLGS